MTTDFALPAAHARPDTPAERRSHISRWLSVVSHLDPKYGGLSAAVPQLASRLSTLSNLPGLPGGECFEVKLAAFCLPGEEYGPAADPGLSVSYWPTSRKAWLMDRMAGGRLTRSFRSRVAENDALHIHGLWEQSTLIAAHTARALRKPYILSAHGMLEPWALERSKAKKQIYAAIFERDHLARAACLHALTRAEAGNYRRFGVRTPIAVIPNAVDVPGNLTPDLFLDAFPQLRDKRIVLFLGRLHQKKGIDLLVRAWARVESSFPDAHLVIAGPSEDGTRSTVEQLIADYHLSGTVLLPGMLAAPMKWSALAAAECFVLPSHSEGLSIAILEAMGASLPVIITDTCNLPEVVEHRAGWQIRPDVDELAAALEDCLSTSRATNRESGRRGAALVSEQYSWRTVTGQMAELYSWVEGGPRPRNVPLETA